MSNSNDPKLMGSIELKIKPVQLLLISHWHDHLEGPKTGKLQLRLMRGGAPVGEPCDIFNGYHQRGEDMLFIHYQDIKEEPIVTEA